MDLTIYTIDAFADRVFSGNPAAICPLESWLPDETLQAIAAENNLSETAYLVRQGEGYKLRWFAPLAEIDLCGHATLAAAFVVLNYMERTSRTLKFETRSGTLTVVPEGDRLTLDFPAWEPQPIDAPPELIKGLRRKPLEVYRTRDIVAVFASEADVIALDPDMDALRQLDSLGIIVTAPGAPRDGEPVDFVSRAFFPRLGVPEDPVCGSAHCTLTTYWARRLGRNRLHARQVSRRGGELWLERRGDRVLISGRAVKYLQGTITI
jgi:PhzF family phenazine biosynthesis protein